VQTSHLNWTTVQQYEPWGHAGNGAAAGHVNGGGQMRYVSRSALVCQRAGRLYTGRCLSRHSATRSCVGSGEWVYLMVHFTTQPQQLIRSLRRDVYVYCSHTAQQSYCSNLRDTFTINGGAVNTDYWLPVRWKLRILEAGKNFLIL